MWESLLAWWKNLGPFFSIPNDITIWHLLNSTLAAGLITAYATWQAGKARASREAAEASEGVVEAVEETDKRRGEELEEPPIAAGFQPGADFRDQTAELVQRARDYIQQKMDADPDLRHQRTYGRLSGHRPDVRAVALYQRAQITERQLSAALQIFHLWNRYARGHVANRPVPEQVHDLIDDQLDVLQQE